MVQKRFSAHLALFFVNMLYGANHVLAKGVMPQYLSPNVFILFRVFVATILFWILKLLFAKTEKVERKDLFLLASCALFGVAINQLFFFHGLNLSSSINSGIFMSMNPIMVVILSIILLKERISSLRLLGIAIGSIATILLTLTAGSGKNDSYLGDFFLFINALSYAIYLVIAKPIMSKYSPLTVITWVFSFGLVYLLLFPPVLCDFTETNFSAITNEVWMKIIYVIVGVTFLTYLLTMYGLKYLTPSVSSVYIYFQPILVIVFSFLFLFLGIADDYTQTITAQKIGYMLLIFLGVYLTGRTENQTRSSN